MAGEFLSGAMEPEIREPQTLPEVEAELEKLKTQQRRTLGLIGEDIQYEGHFPDTLEANMLAARIQELEAIAIGLAEH